jgi:hypothetical protein
MPDLIVETRYACLSTREYETTIKGSKGNEYAVSYGPDPLGKYQYHWSCNCKGFAYKGKCKHIEIAKNDPDYCGWDQEIHGNRPIYYNGIPRCPVCLGNVVTYQVGP